MLTTVKYIFLTALRDWLFPGIFGALLVAYSLAAFLGDNALVEQQQMTVVYVAGTVRVVLNVGLIVFVCFHVRRMFENREIEVILSRPISRPSFVFAYTCGFAFIMALLVVPLAAIVSYTLPVHQEGMTLWSLSLFLESLLVIAFALFASLVLRSAVSSVLLSFGFYVITRMLGFFLYMFEQPVAADLTSVGWLAKIVLKYVAMVMPRLDLYAHSEWLVYGPGSMEEIAVYLLQSLIFIPLLLLAAIFDFKRKQF